MNKPNSRSQIVMVTEDDILNMWLGHISVYDDPKAADLFIATILNTTHFIKDLK